MTGPALPAETDPTSWATWDRTHRAEGLRTVRPVSIEQLSEAMAAISTAGLSARFTGAGHSFTDLAEPQDIRVDLTDLRGLVSHDAERRQATFLGGTPLLQAARELEDLGLALASLPDTLHPTVAGAVSTASHGTGMGFGSLSAQTTGLTVVLADGSVHECSPDRQPRLFQAARSGLGAIGAIAAVTFAVEPSFRLHSAEFKEPLEPLLGSLGERMAAADHFELLWEPGWTSAHTHTMTRLHRLPDEWTAPGSRVTQGMRRMDDAVLRRGLPAGLNRLAGAVPRSIPQLRRLDPLALAPRSFTDLSYKVFAASRPVRFVQTEWAVPLETLPQAVGEVRELLERSGVRLGVPLTVRCSAPEETWLSPAHGRYTGWITVRQFWRHWEPGAFESLHQLLLAHGGRPHWGGRHTLTAEQLAPLYPQWDEFLAVREQADPQGLLLTAPLRRLLGL